MRTNLEKKLRNFIIIVSLGAFSYFSSSLYADTIYYGKIDKSTTTTQKAAYIEFDKVKVKSKYHTELEKISKNDPQYNVILEKRNQSVRDAIRKTGEEGKYDVVVEKDDPKIEGCVNIAEVVEAKLEEIKK